MKMKLMMTLAATWLMTTALSATEQLNRALVAFNTDNNTTFVSWRFFDGEKDYTYRLYRNGVKMVETRRTSHTFPIESKPTDVYRLEVLSGGSIVDQAEVTPYDQRMKIALQKPDPSVNNNSSSYTPNDVSIGDVDGDGEMELFVKWDPADSQDNSKSGKTSNVIIDCYKMDGTRLWSVNLGPNIRAGAHYTQFLVYDFDGDGRAEMICKTAPWSKDGNGKYVSEAADDATIKGTDNSARQVLPFIPSGTTPTMQAASTRKRRHLPTRLSGVTTTEDAPNATTPVWHILTDKRPTHQLSSTGATIPVPISGQ